MPTREPLILGPFASGINTFDDPSAVKDNELVEALNFDTGMDGSLMSRPAFNNINQTLTLSLTGMPRFLGWFYSTGGQAYLIVTSGGATYAWRNNAFTLITLTFAAADMTQY